MSNVNDNNSSMPRPALFLDRGGTLIECCGHLRVLADVTFYTDTITSLRLLQLISGVSNWYVHYTHSSMLVVK